MSEKTVTLSKRLRMLADLVPQDAAVADVGCDHGFLSIYLVQKGICRKVLAMDVRKGPLSAASEHIAEHGLTDRIQTRLSDGLIAMESGEADTMVCAGMGGPLMAKILSDSMDKAREMKTLILQPQSELKEFRVFLRKNGFRILKEEAMLEDGKYYFAEVVSYDGARRRKKSDVFDEYGELLLKEKNPILKQYLEFQKNVYLEIRGNLSGDSERTRERLQGVEKTLENIEIALGWYR